MPFDGKSKYFSGGRHPEGEMLRKRCRKVTEQVVNAWIDALKATDADGNPDHEIRIKAANALADRGYGKPAQEIAATVDVNGAEPHDLHAQIAAIVASTTSEADPDPTGETN